MTRRLTIAAVLAVVFLGGAYVGPDLLSPSTATAQTEVGMIPLANFNGGAVVCDLEYDTGNNRATGVICTNSTDFAVRIEVWRQSDRLLYSQRFPPGVSRINIPTAPAGRIQLLESRPGMFQGFDVAAAWPVD